MKPHIRKRLLRTLSLSAFALLIGAGIGYMQISQQAATVIKREPAAGAQTNANIAGVQVGGPFTLTDQDGKTVTEKTYDGKYKLIFFGFSYCPSICPTELSKMAKIMKELGASADKVQPIFISTDPARDTPAVLKDYVSLYHPKLVGLTGTPDQIETIKKSYRVFASKVPGATPGDYSIDHSSFTYLMGPQDAFIGIYRSEDTADKIAGDIKSVL